MLFELLVGIGVLMNACDEGADWFDCVVRLESCFVPPILPTGGLSYLSQLHILI